jgi:hypothetical protein
MKRKIEETTTTTTATTTTTTTSATSAITLKDFEEKDFEGEEEIKQEYSFNKKQRITLSLLPQRESANNSPKAKHDLSFARKSSRLCPDDYGEQISLKQSKFLSHDSRSMLRFANHEPLRGACAGQILGLCSGRSPNQSPAHDSRSESCAKAHDLLCKSCLKINDENRLKSHDLPKANHEPQYICLNINILDIPNDILGIIIIFTDIIGKHVLRFANKYFHNIVHSVVVSNLLLPKEFHECSYDHIAAELGNIKLYDWVMFIFGESEYFRAYGLNIAALNGHLNLMKHMKKNYNYKWSEFTCPEAAKGGHLEVLKWLKEGGCSLEKETCEMAAAGGHLEILKWSRENGCPWSKETCSFAAERGNFEILKWARENGCPWDSNTTYAAVVSGHLEILKWAIENGCECYHKVPYCASKNGHLELLKWARENGYHWDGGEFGIAVNKGHLDILKWLLDNGFGLTGQDYLIAENSKNLEIKEWIKGIKRP